MDAEPAIDPASLFAGYPAAYEAYRIVHAMLVSVGPVEVRTTPTQVAFRRRRGLAYLWLPVAWARRPGVEVVLSIALGRLDDSTRWKQVAHPARDIWMHHLEVRKASDFDAEVQGWLGEAYTHAA
jgi:hypothetical protein